MDLGRALLGGVLDVDHGFQRLVFDRDQFGGVARLRFRFRDDERDAVADAAHLVGDQQRQERAVALRRAEILRHQVRGHAGELVGSDVGAGEDGEHAGRRLRLRNVDLLDAGVGVRREHVDAEGHAGQHDVVDIAALAYQEALVLDPAHRLSDPELGHGVPPSLMLEEMLVRRRARAEPARATCVYAVATEPRSMRNARVSRSATWPSLHSAIRIETPCALQGGHHLAEAAGERRGETLERLVEQQDAPPGHQRARERHHLLLAAGQLQRAAVAEILHLRHDRENPVSRSSAPSSCVVQAGSRMFSSTVNSGTKRRSSGM